MGNNSDFSMTEEGGPHMSPPAASWLKQKETRDQRWAQTQPMVGWSCFPSQGKLTEAAQSLRTCCGSESGEAFQRCLCPLCAGDTGRKKWNAGTERADCMEHRQHSAGPHSLYSEKERERESMSTIQTASSVTRKPTQRKLGQCVAC